MFSFGCIMQDVQTPCNRPERKCHEEFRDVSNKINISHKHVDVLVVALNEIDGGQGKVTRVFRFF